MSDFKRVTAHDLTDVSRRKISIVALLIVRNEDRCIKKCIDHIIGKFDEVIIIDTGSTDNTLNILNGYVAKNFKLLHCKWPDSFAEARNYALKYAKGKFVFFLDADEYLQADRNEIKNIFQKRLSKKEFLSEIICPKIVDHDGNYTTGVPRAYFNSNDLYYFGDVHEELRSDINTLNLVVDEKIIIEHDGYLDDVIKSKDKMKRNVELLRKTVKKEPYNPRWTYFLYRDGYELFDAKYSIRKINKSLDFIEESGNFTYKTALIDLIVRYHLKTLSSEEEFEKALFLLDQTEPNNTNSIFYKTLYNLKKWKEKANDLLISLIEYRENHQTDIPDMLHSQGFHLDSAIAIYLFECGHYKQSEKLFRFLIKNNYQPNYMHHYFSLFENKARR